MFHFCVLSSFAKLDWKRETLTGNLNQQSDNNGKMIAVSACEQKVSCCRVVSCTNYFNITPVREQKKTHFARPTRKKCSMFH